MTALAGLLVVDASVALKWELNDEDHVDQAVALKDDYLIRGAVRLTAPHLFPFEIVNAMVSASRRGRLTPDQARRGLPNLLSAGVQLVTAPAERFFSLALQYQLSGYDAAYVALAEAMSTELWTGNRRLFEVVGSAPPWVRWIGDYPL